MHVIVMKRRNRTGRKKNCKEIAFASAAPETVRMGIGAGE
jgi:hypothetical protein